MNLSLPEQEVRRLCLAQGVSISAIEPLQVGRHRTRLHIEYGRREMRLRLRGHLIEGSVVSHRFYRPSGSKKLTHRRCRTSLTVLTLGEQARLPGTENKPQR